HLPARLQPAGCLCTSLLSRLRLPASMANPRRPSPRPWPPAPSSAAACLEETTPPQALSHRPGVLRQTSTAAALRTETAPGAARRAEPVDSVLSKPLPGNRQGANPPKISSPDSGLMLRALAKRLPRQWEANEVLSL